MKAIVWSKQLCPFCDQAKELLKQKGYTIEERKIGDEYTTEDLLEVVPGAKSVPQVFIDEKYIGGFSELRQHLGK